LLVITFFASDNNETIRLGFARKSNISVFIDTTVV